MRARIMPHVGVLEGRAAGARLPVGILGATGIVGQRMVALLEGHPLFRVAVLGASPASIGKAYGEAVKWRIATHPDVPAGARDLTLVPCSVEAFAGCAWVFSALDAGIAVALEVAFCEAGHMVFSNSSAHRMSPAVPLVVPTANAQALSQAILQRSLSAQLPSAGSAAPGMLVANANCTTSGIAVVLAAIIGARQAAEAAPSRVIESIAIHSLQSISGAGISPGLSAYDIDDNVVPFIEKEEEKVEEELYKILSLCPTTKISASCNRVMVSDGHTVNLAVKFARGADGAPQCGAHLQTKGDLVAHVRERLAAYAPLEGKIVAGSAAEGKTGLAGLFPSCPPRAIHLFDAAIHDRPQPKLDRMRHGGMCVSVGRVRECSILDVKLTLVLNNTVLGAAGSALLNAEIVHASGCMSAASS